MYKRQIVECYGEKAEKALRYAIKKEPGIFDLKQLQKVAQSLPGAVSYTHLDVYKRQHMCYAASKLWNVCNYERRRYKELELEKYPDWYYQKKAHKGDLWYRQLDVYKRQHLLSCCFVGNIIIQ